MRVLILSASTGGGHIRASTALRDYIKRKDAEANVEIVDTLDYIHPILNRTVTEGYEILAKRTPRMYGIIYRKTNQESPLKALVYMLNHLFGRKLLPLLGKYRPDIIITTHPFPTEMVSALRERGKVKVPLVCVMTDYAPHRTWINDGVDAYIVSNEGMIDVMEKMGVRRERIYPFGIPIEDVFSPLEDKTSVLKELGLCESLPTVLIMAGSFGVSNILEIYRRILEVDVDFQVIVITGRNAKLYNAFEKLLSEGQEIATEGVEDKGISRRIRSLSGIGKGKARSAKKRTKLLFFTDEVYKYMQASDLIITKPGGLTVSEALACNLPMALFHAIPGQEQENADFLIDNNMAVAIGKGETCKDTIKALLTNHATLDRMRKSCETHDKSSYNEDIVALIYQLAGKELKKGKGNR